MSSALHPVKVATASAELLLLTVVLWVFRGYEWPTLSPVEVSPLQALLDPTLFRHDFAVQESLRFSPRFYYNELILLPARAGLPLAWSFAVWHLGFLAILAAALRYFARRVGLGPLALAAFTVWLVTLSPGSLGGVFFYTHAPVPAVWAGALALLGGALALGGRLPAAFACFGAAALLQFLVGFYAGLLALPALWFASPRQRLTAVALWLLGLAFVYLPMRVAGATEAGVFDDATFVEIYAHLRHPHHLVPSTWASSAWVQAVSFYLGAWLWLRRTSGGRPPFEGPLLLVTLALTGAALAANWLFVEIWPCALVAKLQPARITPLAQVVVFALLATRLPARLRSRDWLGTAILIAIPFAPFPGLLFTLAAVLIPFSVPEKKFAWPHKVLLACVLISFRVHEFSLPARFDPGTSPPVLFGAVLATLAIPRRLWVLGTAAACTVAVSGLLARASLSPNWRHPDNPRWFSARFCIDAPPFDLPARLGARFRALSPPDACVLVPPTSQPWSFKLFARRSVVVDDKNTPFTDRGLREWKDRMDATLGTPLLRDTQPIATWRARSPEALQATAARYGARYILTHDRLHPRLPGRKLDTELGWSIWELP